MTNYNERLDEVLFKIRTTRNVEHNDGQWSTEFVYSLDEAKQALTSFIKEMVEETKPEYISPDQPLGLKYQGRNEAIREFEQNILKALEQ